MTDRELMQWAYDAIEPWMPGMSEGSDMYKVAIALNARLAQPEPEPTAYLCENAVGHKYFRWKKPTSEYKPIALYTAPPQREWQGLSLGEAVEIWKATHKLDEAIRLIEAKLKAKNV